MYTLIVQNKYGQQLELTHNPAYTVYNIEGLDPPDAQINTTHNAGYDGSVFNSAYEKERTIVITMTIESPAEVNRIALYRYLKTKFPVRVFYKNGTRDVFIDGFVQAMQIGFFQRKQVIQITIFCPHSNFSGTVSTAQDFSTAQPLFEFPFEIEEPIPFSEIVTGLEKSIINAGDVDTGVMITIDAIGEVTNPKIYNVDNSTFMILNVSMVAGDTIRINTRQGEKSITMRRAGVETNLIGSMQRNSSWFSLVPGDNIFTTAADDGVENMMVTFTVVDQYQGV